MILSIEEISVLTTRLIALTMVLQTLELLAIRKSYGPSGIWREPSSTLMRSDVFTAILVLRVLLACSLFVAPNSPAFLFLFFSSILISLRWRGSFNGGSDFMNLVTLSAMSVASVFGGNTLVLKGCLWYIALQSVTSYLIAGAIKLKRVNWRNGSALRGFLGTSLYAPSELIGAVTTHPAAASAFSLGLIAFECSFPLALVSTHACAVYIGLAVIFHLACFYAFGLNRFVLSWACTYPALYFCSGLLSQRF